jgi:hypothetical protein
MPGLDEHEILERLKEAFREAIEACRLTGSSAERGIHYVTFMNAMKHLEGCCRQIAWCRDDTRWMEFANLLMPAVSRAGGWIREYRVTHLSNPAKALFDKLADMLESKLNESNDLRYNATGRTGMILPDYCPPVRSQFGRSAGGIILPPGYGS